MRDALHPLWELTAARVREFLREPAAVFWVFAFPVLLSVGLGIAFRNRPPERSVIALDSAFDAPLAPAGLATVTQALRAPENSDRIDLHVMSAPEAHAALRKKRVDLWVTQATTEIPALAYHYDSARAEARLARLLVDDIVQSALGRRSVMSTADHTESAPGGAYIDFLLPGLIGLNIMGSSMWGLGYAIVLMRKRGLLKRFAATPMRRGHYLLAFALSRLVFLSAEVVFLVLFGALAFGVSIRGSYAAVGAISLAGAAAFAGVALLIASRTDNVEVASGWMNFVMLPMWMLSGAFFSYERFPEATHSVIRILPLTAMNDALRAIVNDSATLSTVLPQFALLSAWALVSFVAALRRFRWY